MSEYSNPILSFIFQNLNFFRFSCHIIRLVCRVVMIFLLTQSARLEEPFKYLENGRKVHIKFCRGLWKTKFSSKPEFLSEYSNTILSFIFSSGFELKLVFQRPLENFLWTLRSCSRYLKGSSNLANCVSKKNCDHTTHQTDYMAGKAKKKLRF